MTPKMHWAGWNGMLLAPRIAAVGIEKRTHAKRSHRVRHCRKWYKKCWGSEVNFV